MANTNKGNVSPTRTERMENGTTSRVDVKYAQKAKRNNKTKPKYPTSDRPDRKVKKSNDPAWYAKSPAMMSAAASINWYQPLGSPVDIEGLPVGANVNAKFDFESVPGLMVLHYDPGIGYSADEVSAASIAARSIYTDVRFKQSGHANYEAPNLMMYIIAAANAYAYLAWMRRLYCTIRMYNSNNKYMPFAMLNAMTTNVHDIAGKGYELYFYIQEYQAKLSAFCFPSGMPFFERYLWMNSCYWLDAPMEKAQIYMFEPNGFYYYDETSNPGQGQLTYYPMGTLNTIDKIRGFGDVLVGALSDSEDCYIMSGDIYKAFGEAVYKMDILPQDAAPEIKYSPEVLEQIHNATVINGTITTASRDITEDVNTGALIFEPIYQYWSTPYTPGSFCAKRMFSICLDSPSPEATMVASRLMVFGDNLNNRNVHVTSCGTEIVTGMDIFYYYRDALNNDAWTLASKPVLGFDAMIDDTTLGANIVAWLDTVSLVNAFAYHPFVSITRNVEVAGNVVASNRIYFWDLDNVTVVTEVQIDRMHETALLSMFDVPEMGFSGSHSAS